MSTFHFSVWIFPVAVFLQWRNYAWLYFPLASPLSKIKKLIKILLFILIQISCKHWLRSYPDPSIIRPKIGIYKYFSFSHRIHERKDESWKKMDFLKIGERNNFHLPRRRNLFRGAKHRSIDQIPRKFTPRNRAWTERVSKVESRDSHAETARNFHDACRCRCVLNVRHT